MWRLKRSRRGWRRQGQATPAWAVRAGTGPSRHHEIEIAVVVLSSFDVRNCIVFDNDLYGARLRSQHHGTACTSLRDPRRTTMSKMPLFIHDLVNRAIGNSVCPTAQRCRLETALAQRVHPVKNSALCSAAGHPQPRRCPGRRALVCTAPSTQQPRDGRRSSFSPHQEGTCPPHPIKGTRENLFKVLDVVQGTNDRAQARQIVKAH